MSKPLDYLDRAAELIVNPDQLIDFLEEFMKTVDSHKEGEIGEIIRIHNHVAIAKPREPLVIIGDLHGDDETLATILEDPDIETALEQGLVVFLGDYVDRGPHQLETILVPMLMYVDHPDHVILLRGNHEPPPELVPYPHDFPFHLKVRYPEAKYPGFAEKLYEMFVRDVFPRFPDAALVEGNIFLVHGGPPTTMLEAERWTDALAVDEFPTPLPILEELLWNDPCECDEPYRFNPRGAGKLWGKPVTEATLKLTSTRLIIRGHEVAQEGYKFNHDDKVLTLFSRLGEPYSNEKAAYIVVRFVDEWYKRENLEKMIKVIVFEE